MFGNIHKRRMEQQRENRLAQDAANAADRYDTPEEENELTERVNKMSDDQGKRQDDQRAKLNPEATAAVTEQMPGMSAAHKLALQESASNQIANATQNQARLASSKMGASGVRGGAANAVQAEVQDKGMQARNQFNRDLMEQNEETAKQQLAAKIALIEGRMGNYSLNDAQAYDRLTGKRNINREKGQVKLQTGQYGREGR